MKNFTFPFAFLFAGIQLIVFQSLQAQYPLTCGSVVSRANSNGLANKCPNVSGTPYASNFTGTSFATVPTLAKTGNITFRYANAAGQPFSPYAITKVWQTSTGTAMTNVVFGPASEPVVDANNPNDILVEYCFYGVNMPTVGTLSFEMSNPETGFAVQMCSFDAGCNGDCNPVSNPINLLPVRFNSFTAKEAKNGIQLDWVTEQESSCKGYQVQRSLDGNIFSDLGFVAAAGSSLKNTYTYTDVYAGRETALFYRIRQRDLDGGSLYSSVVKVSRNSLSSRFAVTSRPGEVMVTLLSGSLTPFNYSAALYSSDGNLRAERKILTPGSIYFPNLNSGLYYVRIVSEKGERKTFAVSCR